MPVFKSGDPVPDWCELKFFDVVNLQPGDVHRFERKAAKEKLIVGAGRCRLSVLGEMTDVEERANINLDSANGVFEVVEVYEPTTLIRMAGVWQDDVGGSGLFSVDAVTHPKEKGDPAPYTKSTGIDNHYHDCDEYWIVFQGCGEVVSEKKHYEVGVGDCLAIGMGWHHDFPRVDAPVMAVYFETTMQREKRRGHLWEHTHGPARPVLERV
jgi:mannose-6-phosphate isomerase-like protein (cupin superfamily)